MRKWHVAAMMAAMMGIPATAAAQSYVRADCRALVAKPAARFDDGQHRAWYHRFWNGDCGDLAFCSPGSPNWNEAVQLIHDRAPPARRAALTAKACKLGRLIGMEWSRDNSIRKIDTGELSSFYDAFDQSQDEERALADVERRAHADLGR